MIKKYENKTFKKSVLIQFPFIPGKIDQNGHGILSLNSCLSSCHGNKK